jgi:hypothetical protein
VFARLLKRSATLEKNDDRIKEHDRLTSSIRGSRLSYIAAGAPGGGREFGVAGSFNFRPFNSGSELKLEFNGMLT